ncbi:MAG: helicase-exonuclease AddAB subunit AddA [Clostridia bacterium]|nr:helicase-exonuclease AddAB subunit AddA [Clostridia bacterium]
MKWTDKQKQAIEARNSNILVAAAAGSGKTAVLVERIKRLIIEDGVPIDRMLVVTFTNAAAAEMKEKIRNAIYKEIEENPEQAPALREQLNLLTRANISTFHAFALEIIRTFFYNRDIEPNFAICDDSQRTILKEDAMDNLMEECFEEGKPAFHEFLDKYSSSRNQRKVRNIIDDTYNSLQALPYPWKWLDENIDELRRTPEEYEGSQLEKQINAILLRTAEEILETVKRREEILSGYGLDRLSQKVYEKEILPLEEAWDGFSRDGDMSYLKGAILHFETDRLTANKEEKEIYADCKGQVQDLGKTARELAKGVGDYLDWEVLRQSIEDMNATVPEAETLRELLVGFDIRFMAAKAEKNLVDFGDIEHFALSILEDEEVSNYYREKFEYIFIDEYQDTNVLQEEIISRIKRDDNLFMVGDIKQSIYKFRLAEPEIFQRKYEEYSHADKSMKIDLNQNFRSKSAILQGINDIFEEIMDGYDDDARLYPGIDYDGPYNYMPQTIIVDTENMADADPSILELNKTEIEALKVCDIIEDHLGKPFYDHKAGVERPLEKRDIVILMRGVRNYAGTFYNILKSRGIDAFVDDSDGYFDTMEINVFLNLLSVIDNRHQDVPLISVLHSEIFNFSSSELARVRAQFKTGSYCDAFIAYSREGHNEDLRKKCISALNDMTKWKELSATMPLGNFLWKLLTETGYYMQMGSMPGGAQRQANLRVLVDKAESFSSDRQVSLYGFIRYIETVKEKKVDIGQVKLLGEQDDLVRIMTIHKSKGLEFPMVIVCGMGRNLNYTKMEAGVSMHKDVGLGLTLVNYEEKWLKKTLIQQLIARRVKQEEVDEEKRILYVAMTRAKDILYMVGTSRKTEDFTANAGFKIGDKNYLSMVGFTPNKTIIPATALTYSEEDRNSRPVIDEHILDDETLSKEQRAEILRRLNYSYPYEAATLEKQKYSVTELNKLRRQAGNGEIAGADAEHVREVSLKAPNFLGTDRKLSAAEKGLVYHSIMEHLDFGRAVDEGMAYVKEAVEEMVTLEVLTEEEAGAVWLKNILDFFGTGVGQRAAAAFKSGKLAKEKPFVLKTKHDGDEILVQGIIDCFFEEEGGYVLVDYKTNWIDPSKSQEEEFARLRETYGEQLRIYANAIEKGKGKAVKEAYLYLANAGLVVEM